LRGWIRGDTTNNHFDFTLPFTLRDFSRKSWLRYFFFHCNCLCAPTAMIRRSAYAELGSYDPRLTNLQDLDMWVRMSAGGFGIHVMRAELSAFRVFADKSNLSGPRRETALRSQFEYSRILKRYRAMDPGLLLEVFGDDLAAKGLDPQGPHDVWLAELALAEGSPAHRAFAVETLFDAARSDAQCHQLREIAGRVDVFGIAPSPESDRRVQHLNFVIAERNGRIASLERASGERDEQAVGLARAMVERERDLEAIIGSRSWRYTAPLRWIRGAIRC
jgi:hypothetical protein